MNYGLTPSCLAFLLIANKTWKQEITNPSTVNLSNLVVNNWYFSKIQNIMYGPKDGGLTIYIYSFMFYFSRMFYHSCMFCHSCIFCHSCMFTIHAGFTIFEC